MRIRVLPGLGLRTEYLPDPGCSEAYYVGGLFHLHTTDDVRVGLLDRISGKSAEHTSGVEVVKCQRAAGHSLWLSGATPEPSSSAECSWTSYHMISEARRPFANPEPKLQQKYLMNVTFLAKTHPRLVKKGARSFYVINHMLRCFVMLDLTR